MNKKKYLAIFLSLVVLLSVFTFAGSATTPEEDAENITLDTVMPEETQEATEIHPIIVKNADYNKDTGVVSLTLANTSKDKLLVLPVIEDNLEAAEPIGFAQFEINAGSSYVINAEYIPGFEEAPLITLSGQYVVVPEGFTYADMYGGTPFTTDDVKNFIYPDILKSEEITPKDAVMNFINQTGFVRIAQNWKYLVMIVIACVLFYLAIVKGFEPLLLLPIAFGMLLTNLPGADMFHEELFAGGHAHWNLFDASEAITPGLLDYLYLGVKLGIYPCLIFFGVGAMTDFGPMLANPKSLLLGAAAQLGIFVTFLGAKYLGFTNLEASSIGIIGGADGPTAIFVTSKLAPHLLGPIAVAAYSYMALVPVIQPPIMKLLTTKKERQIKMQALRQVSKKEKIIFPIVVTIFVSLLVPTATPLVGALMLGNLFKESGVTERLSKTVQNELMNIVTIFLGITVGATATAETFLSLQTIKIIVMGVVAFGLGTAAGVILAKIMNLFLKNKINPLIGSAGVSAVPMAARVSQMVGQKENPSNFLLMHAMGPNVAGVIGSAIAAGVLIALFG